MVQEVESLKTIPNSWHIHMHMHTQLYTTFASTPQTSVHLDRLHQKKKQQHSLGAKSMQHIPRLLSPYLSAAESFLSHSVPQWTRPSVTTLVLHQSLNIIKQWQSKDGKFFECVVSTAVFVIEFFNPKHLCLPYLSMVGMWQPDTVSTAARSPE